MTTAGANRAERRKLEKATRRAAESRNALDRLLAEAVALHQSGRAGEAERLYRQGLERAPDHPDLLHLLGVARSQQGDPEAAATLITRALAIRPGNPDFHANLGWSLSALGRGAEAAAAFDRALALAPGHAGAKTGLARLADPATAGASVAADAWMAQARRAGDLAAAGRFDDALAIYEPLVAAHGDEALLWCDYGAVLYRSQRAAPAVEALRRAVTLDPTLVSAHINLAAASVGLGRLADAEAAFRAAIALDPQNLRAHLGLCDLRQSEHREDEAWSYARAALVLPGLVPELALIPRRAFRRTADLEGIAELGEAWPAADAAIAHPSMSDNFLPLLVEADAIAETQRLIAVQRRWGGLATARARAAPLPGPVSRRHAGRLKVGLLSSDLRRHSVAKFVLPLLHHYDRDRLELTAYSLRAEPDDPVQRTIRGLVDRFVDVEASSDRAVAARVRDDGVELLIELNGHTAGSRLPALAWRPAPVQICWLGFPGSSGLAEIDYLLLDRQVQPTEPGLLVEAPLVSDGPWVCIDGFDDVTPAALPPSTRDGAITFGTLNNPYKYSAAAVAAWAAVLAAVPDSRFLVARPTGQTTLLERNLRHAFAGHGIAPDRIAFRYNDATGHLAQYDAIDVALDTYPLSGGTTTCEALWMGVPTVTRRGPAVHQRLSHALLAHAGLDREFSTASAAAFVETAVALARDRARLAELRATLRARLRASPLADAAGFTRDFTAALERAARAKGLR